MSESRQRILLVTPEKVVYDDDARFVVLPGTEGELGILPGHAPLITLLRVGLMRIGRDSEESRFVIAGGLLEVSENRVTILTGAAEDPRKIDLARAQAALARADRRLAARAPEIDIDRARAALMRAIVRLKAGMPEDR
ncbi:MAG TPA: F0F1 ATP synthase subunit epsilon [Desulfotomaculum sp.]|nr:F0F1 ATP synthase subunit epsilon [Desulfotomaculum sp.]